MADLGECKTHILTSLTRVRQTVHRLRTCCNMLANALWWQPMVAEQLCPSVTMALASSASLASA